MTDDATPPADAGQGGDGGQPAASSWTDSLSDDLRGYVENKGWQDPGALLSSYQNLEKLRGVPEDRLISLPNDPNAEGAWDPVYAKLGRPEDPNAYTNAIGEALPKETYGEIAKAAHTLGLSDNQFSGMQKIMGDLSTKMAEAQESQAVEQFDKWKAANPDGFANAARVMAEVGMNEESVAALLAGDKTALYDFAAKIGARTSEEPVIQGDGQGNKFSMTPDAAKAKISELLNDDAFMERYAHSSEKIRLPAIKQMEDLNKIAYPS